MKKVTRIFLVFLGMSSILYAQDSSISSVDEGLNELTAFYIHKGTFDNAQELKKTAVHYFMSNGLVKINEESVVPPSINYENRDLSLQDFLYKHIEYPEASQRLADADQGTEIVEFIVTGEGLIKDIHIINSVSNAIDEEVKRVLNLTLNKWNPAVIDGKVISIRCEIPIVFKAGSETDFTNVAELYFELANKYLYKHNNPRKALKCINKSVKFLPYEEKYLAFHGLCSQISGNILEARKYWNRIAELAKRNNNTEVINFMSDISGQPVDKQLYHNLIRLVNN